MKNTRLSFYILSLGLCMLWGASNFALPTKVKSDSSSIDAGAFVSVKDGQFQRRSERYHFVGVNLWYGAYLGSQSKDVGDRARLVKELDILLSLGVTNVRVLGGSTESTLRDAMSPAISNKNGVQREDVLEGLDFLLSELGKRDMTAVIYLTNFWEWSGGMATYLSYVRNGKIVDPSNADSPWPAFALFSSEFYRDSQAQALFNAYVVSVLNRVNTVTGVAYKNDTSIMSWQLANEPRPGHRSVSKPYLSDYYSWIKKTGTLIKLHAPRQLISIGSEGYMGCIQSEECVLRSHQQSPIDYMTVHLWLKNWGWFDALNPKGTYDPAIAKAKAYIKQHQRLAVELNMPLVLEEFGLERDAGVFSPSSTTQYRDDFFATVYDEVERSVQSGQPLQGTNIWAWGGIGKAEHKDYLWRSGDRVFVGDPPQEPQGLNSVFAGDKTTLNVMKQHAGRLKKIRVN